MEDYTKLKIAYDNIYEEYEKIKNGEKLIELQRNSIANQIQSSDDLINSLKGKKKDKKIMRIMMMIKMKKKNN
jgi:hypothetical protein